MRCANCGQSYSLYSLGNAQWCPNDHVYLCRKCVDHAKCPACGRSTSSLGTILIFQGAIFLVIFGLVAATTVPGDLSRIQQNAAPVTPVAALGSGTSAKVLGTVSLGQGTVITVFTYRDSAGNSVTGRHVEDFWFNDSTGRIWIEMGSNASSTPTIAHGGEPYPSTGTPTGFQYESGDRIAILGKVVPYGNSTALQASAVAPNPTSFSHASATFDELFFGVPMAGSSAAVVAGATVNQRRLRLHLANLPTWVARRPASLREPPATDAITWSPNPYAPKLRRIAFAVNSASLALVAIWLVVVVSPIVFPDAVFLATLVGVPFLLLFTGIYGLSYWTSARRSLQRLGVSSNGVYFDYRRPPKGARTFLAWSDIHELEAPLAINRHGVRFDTPLTKEFVGNLDEGLIRSLRTAFETERTSFRPGTAPLRPSVASLLGTGPTVTATEVRWIPNGARRRWMIRGFATLALLAPALVVLAALVVAHGFNQAEIVLIYPLAIAAGFFRVALGAPREVGISATGVSIRERKGERTIVWADIGEFTPTGRGFRYKTHTGFAESVAMIDAPIVREVVQAFERSRGDSGAALTPPLPSDPRWTTNRVARKMRDLVVLLVGVPIALSGSGVVLAVVVPSYLAGLILLIGLPPILAVFALAPWMLGRRSPGRVALTSEAVFLERSLREPPPGTASSVAFGSIASVKGAASSGIPPAFSGGPTYEVAVRTTSGVWLDLGILDQAIAEAFAAALDPSQLADWKPLAAPTFGRPLGTLRRP